MNAQVRRVLRLQRNILKSIRADVRKVLGPQTPALKRYYAAYKREFAHPSRNSSREELLKRCHQSDVILLGDYHTFAQSQKTACKLLAELVEEQRPITLCLEMIQSRHQGVVDDYLKGLLSETEFLSFLEYPKTWGFPWQNFKPILDFAKEHGIKVVGLNSENPSLDARDRHSATVLAETAEKFPKDLLFVVYGDLHLAKSHLPKQLKRALREKKLRRKILTIFQNSESLYWRLAQSHVNQKVEVVSLDAQRFCVMNAAPWVKLHSYLEWAENSVFEQTSGADDVFEEDKLLDLTHERVRQLAEALGFSEAPRADFTVQTLQDLEELSSQSFWKDLPRLARKTVKYHILGNRTLFVPGPNVLYLPTTSVNLLSEGAALIAYFALSGSEFLPVDANDGLYHAILINAKGYFGSKILNHKRKCDLEDDLKLMLDRKITAKCLPQERLQRTAAKYALRHCAAQKEYVQSGRFRSPSPLSGPNHLPVFLEATRKLGAILGEKMFKGFVEGRLPGVKVERLFRSRYEDSKTAKAAYLKLLSDLQDSRLHHTSKTELF